MNQTGLSSQQVMIAFISFIMIGSIIGFSLMASQNQNTATNTTDNTDNTQQPTPIPFEASGVPARVLQSLSGMIVTARTLESNIDRLDAQLNSIPGIRVRKSFYGQSTGSELQYVAYLSTDSKTPAAQAFEEITKKATLLLNPEGFVNVLVNIPPTVTLTNKDLNLSQEQSFTDPRVQAVAGITTQKEDEIEVLLRVGLLGTKPQTIEAFEERNLTAQPKPIFLQKTLPVQELSPRLTLLADINYRQWNETAWTTQLTALAGVQDANIQTQKPPYKLNALLRSGTDANTQSLREKLTEQNLRFSFDENTQTLQVDFNQTHNLDELESSLRETAQGNGFEVLQLTEPALRIQSNIEMTDASAASASQKPLSSWLETYPAQLINLSQTATFAAEKLNSDENTFYVIPGGQFTADINPGHSVDENVSLTVFLVSIRGNAENIQVQESESAQ
ncbi:MAG: hypothetical protein HY917_01750 [Candidatus Diapherotrites archaeon]|nr:hypothetical protein [Candidatus Diapherotrites archaeon]